MRAGGTELNSEQLKGIAAGDSRAFQILYEAFAPRVYQYAMLRTGSPPDCEEILQETMLAVWNSRSQVVSRSSVGASISASPGIRRSISCDETASVWRWRSMKRRPPPPSAMKTGRG